MQRPHVLQQAALYGAFFTFSSLAAASSTPVGDAHPVIGPEIFMTFDRPFSTHGVAADRRITFINEGFFEPQVHVVNRRTHKSLGSMPEPDGGLSWPFYIRLRNVENVGGGTRGELVLLDSPPPEAFGTPAPSFIHVYEYEYKPNKGFKAELLESHALPVNLNPPDLLPNGLVFPSSFDLLPGGDIAVIDLFSVWVSDSSLQDWRMAWTSPDFGIEPYCSTVTAPNGEEVPGFYLAVRDENWEKVRLPYQLAVPFPEPGLPAFKGITYIDLTDEIAILRVQTPGGIFTIDRPTLMDDSLAPFDKPYSVLVEPEIGLSDLSGDVSYDHYHPDSEWVYWQRTPSESGQDTCAGAHPYSEKWSPIYRVSVLTGDIELVAESWQLYDFPTVLSAIEPMGPGNPFTFLVSSNVLETRVAGLNVLAEETNLLAPTIVPIVRVGAY